MLNLVALVLLRALVRASSRLKGYHFLDKGRWRNENDSQTAPVTAVIRGTRRLSRLSGCGRAESRAVDIIDTESSSCSLVLLQSWSSLADIGVLVD